MRIQGADKTDSGFHRDCLVGSVRSEGALKHRVASGTADGNCPGPLGLGSSHLRDQRLPSLGKLLSLDRQRHLFTAVPTPAEVLAERVKGQAEACR